MRASERGEAVALLLAFCTLFSFIEGQSLIQNGRVNFTGAYPDTLHCETVTYPRTFSGLGIVRVLASISHGEESSTAHDSAVLWTADVTTSSFRVCVMESGAGTNGSVDVNWLAFQHVPSGTLAGEASFSAFTSGTKCNRVNFVQSLDVDRDVSTAYNSSRTIPGSKSINQSRPHSYIMRFSSAPNVLATVRHSIKDVPQDALNMWIEELQTDHFRICLGEVKTFDGKHENIEVDWLAFTEGTDLFTFQGELRFDNLAAPLEQDNFAYCKVVNFTKTFYAAPVVIVTCNHQFDSTNPYSIKPENNVINGWIEEVTATAFRVCIKDLAGMASQHDPVNVDYVVLGDLDPCINVSCNYYAVCNAFGPRDARCVCVHECPSFDEPVCSSNGTTYDNKCVFQREMCRMQANYTLYHPGMCRGFPFQKGRHRLHHSPSWAEVVCEQVSLSPYVFYPDKPVHVQVSVNHANFTDPNYVHEAVVTWVEEILDTNFTVCVTQAGRNQRKNGDTFASVDWLAYQGAPDGGVSGEMDMPTWWTGSSCQSVSLPWKKFQTVPTVLLSAEHERSGIKHDASTVWVEDVTSSSFKMCIRELQNFDGAHESIHINWMAFEELHRPLFREHGAILFSNGKKPSKDFNYAFCNDLIFQRKYNDSPAVLVTANHSTNGRNLNPLYNSISAWVEYVNVTGFRACVKELFVNQYDPLSVSYAIMPDVCEPGWSYYNGSCYYTSESCDSWSNASRMCRDMGSNLVAIESQEENVYVQQRHNGAKAWIGLNDIATEGLFTWVDGCPDKFRYWALNQPNNFQQEDCVHTLGVDHGYMWNDVDCSSCHQYTCKKDFNECTSSPCLNGGTCVNKKANFSCICPHTHKGYTCEEFNECSSDPCLNGGTCTDRLNNYTCTCPPQYHGDRCQEANECHSNPCQNGGTCVDGNNTYSCVCTSSFGGPNCRVRAATSCKAFMASGYRSSGTYYLNIAGYTFQVYCDMSSNSGGWTLISRFSNYDSRNWMQSSGNWWYDKSSSNGSTTSPSSNYDMISPAFWLVTGYGIKISRSDDSSNSALLYTSSSCIGGRTFRSFITSFGNFRNGQVWNSDRCHGSCNAYFGGRYSSTAGFSQVSCSSNLQSANHISFWCDWSGGDGAVMMIGGGGSSCARADHGIGVTEANDARFVSSSYRQADFGDDSRGTNSYSLNLWIR